MAALAAAVRKRADEAVFIRRCRVHKKRDVIDHMPEQHKVEVKHKLDNATR
jgi:hypothetical protein